MSLLPSAEQSQSLQSTVRLLRTACPIVLIGLLVVAGAPLFVRMPVWCDITLYDMAARTLLRGGVHYRDLFDTNTPGYVWLLAGIRSLVGWSSEALRAVDLAFFAGTVFVLDRLAKRGGASGSNRLWSVAGCVGFYLFTQEQVHAQRDVWLALPALAGVLMRVKRIVEPRPSVFRPAFVEGLLWSVAVWIKPHFLVVAAFAWLVTVRRLAGGQPRAWRAAVLDLLGSLAGGVLSGALGVGYLILSGTWPHFVEVMTVWNVGYMETTFGTLTMRLDGWLIWFPPWSFLLPPTVLLALIGLIDARVWSGRFRAAEQGGLLDRFTFSAVWYRGGTDQQRYVRAVFGALYLVWVTQSLVLQRPYHYAHAIEVLLSLAVWASYRWSMAAVVFTWLVVLHVAWSVAGSQLQTWCESDRTTNYVFTPHPLTDPARLRLWPECLRTAETDADRWRRQDALRYETFHAASIGWAELNEVAEFLRPQQVNDRELLCWHDSPHPLYLMLDVKPAIRFMHVNTADMISRDGSERIRAELKANTAVRFAVIDLRWFALLALITDRDYRLYDEPGEGFDVLPPRMPREELEGLPFPTVLPVFRSGNGRGRYVVFAVK
jgi:hypothetical protein